MARMKLTDRLDAGLAFDMLVVRYPEEKWKTALQGVDPADAKCAFISYCANFPSIGFEYDGKAIGGILFDGNEVHMEFLPEFHGRWALLWPQALAWLFSLKDPIIVRVETENKKIQHFIERHNWQRIKADEEYVTYKWTSETVAHLLKRAKKQSDEIAADGPSRVCSADTSPAVAAFSNTAA